MGQAARPSVKGFEETQRHLNLDSKPPEPAAENANEEIKAEEPAAVNSEDEHDMDISKKLEEAFEQAAVAAEKTISGNDALPTENNAAATTQPAAEKMETTEPAAATEQLQQNIAASDELLARLA